MRKFRSWIKRIFFNKVVIGLLVGVFIATPIVGMTTYKIVKSEERKVEVNLAIQKERRLEEEKKSEELVKQKEEGVVKEKEEELARQKEEEIKKVEEETRAKEEADELAKREVEESIKEPEIEEVKNVYYEEPADTPIYKSEPEKEVDEVKDEPAGHIFTFKEEVFGITTEFPTIEDINLVAIDSKGNDCSGTFGIYKYGGSGDGTNRESMSFGVEIDGKMYPGRVIFTRG